jgi:hypothetical protein
MILTLAMLATLLLEPGIVEIKEMSDQQAAIVASNAFVFMQERNPEKYSKRFEKISPIEILLKEPNDVSDCPDC